MRLAAPAALRDIVNEEPAVPDDDDALPPRPLPPLGWRDLLDRVVPPERASRLRLAAAVVALVVVAGAVWWLLRPPPAPATELSLPYAPGASSGAPASVPGPTGTTEPAAPAEIVVHAAGAVLEPGLHRVAAGARVADLLAAAGGPAPEADLDRVNLAAPIADGERVWFPRVGEDAPPVISGGTASAGSDPSAPPGVVDLNTATAEQLEALPGVGPTIAAAIVQHREEAGPFRAVDDLLEVSGIGPARLEQLRERVTV